MKTNQLIDITYAILGKEFTPTYNLIPDGKLHLIGRNPPPEGIHLESPARIKNKKSKEYERLEQIYKYVSQSHAGIICEKNGTVQVIPQKSKYPTFIGTHKNLREIQVTQREQLFPGQILTLGIYSLELTTIDSVAEENLEKKMRTGDTAQEDLSQLLNNQSVLNMS